MSSIPNEIGYSTLRNRRYVVVVNNKFHRKCMAVLGPFHTRLEANNFISERDQYLSADEFMERHEIVNGDLVLPKR